MKSSLLITGAGGFLGREVLAQLDFSKYRTVYCLARRPGAVKIPKPIPPNIEIITGDLMNTTSYESILAGVDTVVHMAAITGKVNPMDYFRVNEDGTKMLLEQCRQNNVCRFIFVSSIAVSFKNKYRYFYALSKENAEMHVRESGLAYTILRPTMIMGRGSAVFEGMARLAGLPVMPVFGKGRHPIQPVHVRDAARAVITVLDDQTDAGPYLNQVLEVGGPDTISMLDFMKKIPALKGTGQPPVFHLPLGLIIFGLSIMERLVYRFLPLSVGQLASFRNHSCVQDNPLQQTLAPEMVGLDSMIMDSLNADDPGNDHPKTVLPKSSEDGTDRQCRVFCRYLVRGGLPGTGGGGP